MQYHIEVLPTFKDTERLVNYIITSDSNHIRAIIFNYAFDTKTGEKYTSLVKKIVQCKKFKGILCANSLSHECNRQLRYVGCIHRRHYRNQIMTIHHIIELLESKNSDLDEDDIDYF
jgi:hypothetical protein